jgi:hypothetical protein
MPPIALSQQAGWNMCREDGGTGKCVDPQQGAAVYSQPDQPFASNGPYYTQLAVYDAFLSIAYCNIAVAD